MLKQLFDIIRSIFTRSGQAIIDKNAIQLMEQKTVDARASIRESESALVDITARRNISLKKKETIELEQTEIGNHLTDLVNRAQKTADDASLETRLAEKFADNENKLRTVVGEIETQNTAIQKTKKTIDRLKVDLAAFESRKDSVKTNAALIKASENIAAANIGANSALGDLEESLDRTEQKQAEALARFDAAQEMADENSGKNLEDDLVKAGLRPGVATASSVLERFKKADAPQA